MRNGHSGQVNWTHLRSDFGVHLAGAIQAFRARGLQDGIRLDPRPREILDRDLARIAADKMAAVNGPRRWFEQNGAASVFFSPRPGVDGFDHDRVPFDR